MTPTLQVLGDVLETILKKLASKSGAAEDKRSSGDVLKRPWTKVLQENRVTWKAKEDAG